MTTVRTFTGLWRNGAEATRGYRLRLCNPGKISFEPTDTHRMDRSSAGGDVLHLISANRLFTRMKSTATYTVIGHLLL